MFLLKRRGLGEQELVVGILVGSRMNPCQFGLRAPRIAERQIVIRHAYPHLGFRCPCRLRAAQILLRQLVLVDSTKDISRLYILIAGRRRGLPGFGLQHG